MKKKSLICILAVLCVFGLLSGCYAFGVEAAEMPLASDGWYYNQLDTTATKLYDGMKQLYAEGGFAKGNGAVDLVKGGYVSADQLKNYMDGDQTLAGAFQNARDAFMLDFYKIFYVDFTKVTLRVGQQNGTFVAYINSGANENFFARGFTSESQVKEAIAEADAEEAKLAAAIKAELDKKLADGGFVAYAPEDVVTLAHNALVERLTYTYPSEENRYTAGVYALADGKANCVGYSGLFKWLMDDFNVPCVLVAGSAQSSIPEKIEGTTEYRKNIPEEHMWNYVKIAGSWYAVDVTWDDPIAVTLADENIRDTYLLRGASDFLANHFPSGIFSPGGKEFDFPVLRERAYGSLSLQSDDGDIKIYAQKATDSAKDVCTELSFTYQNKSLNELKAEGLYFAGRFCYYGEKPQPWVPWNVYSFDENNGVFTLTIYKRGSIEFCITDREATGLGGQTYKDDLALEGNHKAITESFEIPYYSKYKSAPFIYKSEPELTRKIEAVETHFKVEFDDVLVLEDESEALSATANSTQDLPGKITGLKMERGTINIPGFEPKESTVVEFDFTPDTSYQSYINSYSIQLKNVIGEKSREKPNPIPICVSFPINIPCPTLVAAGYVSNNASVIALPTLVVNPNADIFEYDGSDKITALDIRLVATIPSDKEKENFENLSAEPEIKSSAVYDLSLGCQNYIARLKSDAKYNLTIGVPYPEGYNYNSDPNVQFKAYHYVKQPDGSYVAEEVVCRIGERGLEVVVDGFSPFLIVAVPKTAEQSTKKLVNVSLRTHGGDVTTEITDANGAVKTASSSGLYAIGSGSKTFTIAPKEGYLVDKVLLNNKLVSVQNNRVTFDYETMAEDNELEVFFVAGVVKETEKAAGFVQIIGTLERDVLSIRIGQLPKKLKYKDDERFSAEGLTVFAGYNDETVGELSPREYTVVGAEKLTAGKQNITVRLNKNGEILATFTVDVERSGKFEIFIISLAVTVALAGALFVAVAIARKKAAKK